MQSALILFTLTTTLALPQLESGSREKGMVEKAISTVPFSTFGSTVQAVAPVDTLQDHVPRWPKGIEAESLNGRTS